jgi:hypothetical protein
MPARDKNKIQKQLDALKEFPNTKTVRKLRKELQNKLARLESRPKKARQMQLPVSRREVQRQANLARARKVHKYHNYIKQIQKNYPNLTYSQIRKQFADRKRGKQTKIPDVIWRNPSP